MAFVKISELPVISNYPTTLLPLTGGDVLPIVHGPTTYKVELSTLADYFNQNIALSAAGDDYDVQYNYNNTLCANRGFKYFDALSSLQVGYDNSQTGPIGGILGGQSNCVTHACSFAIGSSLTSTSGSTTYMNNATVACHLQVGGTTTMNTTTGRIDASNDVVAFATSDYRLKENIQPIKNALCKLIGVSGNTFDWKPLTKEEIQTIHGNKGRDVGVIAQEIEAILPEAVTTRDNGYKAVNYEKIIPLLIEAIKDQQKQIEELKQIVNGITG